MGASDHEFAGGVDMESGAVSQLSHEFLKQRAQLRGNDGYGAGNEDVAHIACDSGEHLGIGALACLAVCLGGGIVALVQIVEIVVLGGDDDGVDLHRAVLLVIFHCHLALGIGAQIATAVSLCIGVGEIGGGGVVLSLAADFRQLFEQRVRQSDSQRNQQRSLVAGIAEHHPLVACALVVGIGALHTAVDVVALLMDGREHAARFRVKLVVGVVVADLLDHLAGGAVEVDIGVGFHLSGDNHLTGCDKSLTCHFRLRVGGKKLVEDSVGNLIGDFVGMTFGN